MSTTIRKPARKIEPAQRHDKLSIDEIIDEYGENLITKVQAARLINVSDSTINRAIANGRLRQYRVGGTRTIRVKLKDVRALIEEV